jgi:hypothetical protein
MFVNKKTEIYLEILENFKILKYSGQNEMLRDIQGLENSLIKQYYSFLYFHKSSHPISIGFKSCKLHNSIEPWMSQDLCTYIAILTLHMMLLISVIIFYNCSNIFKCSLINISFPLEEKKKRHDVRNLTC